MSVVIIIPFPLIDDDDNDDDGDDDDMYAFWGLNFHHQACVSSILPPKAAHRPVINMLG